MTGEELMYGQWSSPALWNAGKEPRIVFPAGDGRLHMLDANGKLLWSVDLNYPDATKWSGEGHGTRCFAVNAPTIRGSRAYVAITMDMEMSLLGRKAVCAVDLDDRTPNDKRVVWRFSKPRMVGIFGKLLVDDADRLFALTHGGEMLCVDAKSGRELGSRQLSSFEYFGTPTLVAGKVVVGAMGLYTMAHEPKMTAIRDDEGVDDESVLIGAPVFEDGVLYVVTSKCLAAIRWPK